MEKRAVILCLFLLIFHQSCVNESVLTIEMGDPMLVLNASLSPKEDITIHLSKSFQTGSKLSDAELKEPAVVRLFLNNQFKGTLIPMDRNATEEEYGRIRGRYTLPGIRPSAGDEIRIEAEVAGYPIATVTTSIPEETHLLSVDTIRYLDAKDKEMMRLNIKMKDKESQRNYYHAILSKEITTNGVKSEEQFPYFDSYYGYYSGFGASYGRYWHVNYEDPVFTADLSTHSIGSSKRYEFGVFTDNLFNGKEYTLKLSFSDPEDSFRSDTADVQVKYNIKLLSVSESYYNYYKRSRSLSLVINQTQLTPVIDNYMSYSNVRNGFGLVFSYNEAIHEIDMPYIDRED